MSMNEPTSGSQIFPKIKVPGKGIGAKNMSMTD